MRASFFVACSVIATLAAQAPPGGDWPQWRGPARDGLSGETGLLKQWPAGGPPRVWSAANLGAGYGSVAVSGDRVFVQGMQNRQSMVTALNRADGKVLWTKALGSAVSNDMGPGPRSTPTINASRAFVLTENGDLACLRVTDGFLVWQRNILKDFGGRNLS